MLGAAAVALIQAHDVEAARPGLGGDAAHVMGVARAFEAVQGDERRARETVLVPVTVCQDAGVVRDVEVAGLGRRQLRKGAPLRPGVQRHLVAAGPAPERDEFGDHL
jgi:hypothetical protein